MDFLPLSALALGVPLALNLALTPLIIKLADRYKFYDRLNARKIHTGNISRLAGIGIFLAFAAGAVAVAGVTGLLPQASPWLVLPLAGGVAVFAIGVVDDFYELRARYKLWVQLAAAAAVVVGGFTFSYFDLPGFHLGIGLGWVGYIITFCWVLGIINAINLIDGMDGLSGTTGFMAALGLGLVYALTGHQLQAVLALGLAGALFGFLCYNRPKARIFMGDGGAYFLGFALAFLPLVSAPATAPELVSGAWLPEGRVGVVHAVTLLLIPIADTLAAIVRRKRKGMKFSEPDRHHMHHKLLAKGWLTWKVLLCVAGIELALAAAAVCDILFGSWLSAAGLAASWVLVLGFFTWLDRSQPAEVRAGTAG